MLNRFAVILLVFPALPVSVPAEEAVVVGSQWQLFLDDYIIEQTHRLTRTMHQPVKRGPVIVPDQPWETVLQTRCAPAWDEEKQVFKIWLITSTNIPGVAGTSYAESKDGVHWIKPALRQRTIRGYLENNFIAVVDGDKWPDNGIENVVCDPDDPDPDWRFKGFYGVINRRPMVSPDGIHWKPIQEKALLTQRPTDNGGDGFLWDNVQGQYVAYLRIWYPYRWQDSRNRRSPTIRAIARATSPDFLNWSDLENIDLGGAPRDHFYTNGITPYFRSPHIFLSFPKRFIPWRTRISDAPDSGASDVVFMTSRDGLHWDRTFLESFIRPGRDPKNWINRSNLTATGVVETADDEISLRAS